MPDERSIDKLKNVLGDKYEVVSLIASGGMGEIYLGIHRVLGKKRAIKVIHQSVEKEKDIRQRFLQEARLAASIDHPGIIQIMDFGSHDEFDYLIMPFIEGHTLQEEMEKGPLDPEFAIDLMTTMAEALAHTHKQNVIHRDIKPSNFMIDPEGRVILTDFGISKNISDPGLTATNMIMGSPKFMSPEQISGKPVDKRSDLYSLGLIFHQMVTGVYPFATDSIASLAYKQVNESPPPPSAVNPSVPAMIGAVILKLLEKDPDRRYAGGDLLLEDLYQLKQGLGGTQALPGYDRQLAGETETRTAAPVTPFEHSGRKIKAGPAVPAGPASRGNRRTMWIALALGVCTALLIIAFLTLGRVRDPVTAVFPEDDHRGIALRTGEERDKAFLDRFKAHDRPLVQSDVRTLFSPNACIKEIGGSEGGPAADLGRFLAAIPFVRYGHKGGCDVLMEVNTQGAVPKVTLSSNLYECHDACEEELTIQAGRIPFDKIETLLERNYIFNLFKILHRINMYRGTPVINLEIPGKSDSSFIIGEAVQFCLGPPFQAETMLLNINTDGIFKLFPLDTGQRSRLYGDESGCTRVVQVSPPTGNEMLVALGSGSESVVRRYNQLFDSRMPIFTWSYGRAAENNAIDLSETLFRELANQPPGSWTAKSRFIRVASPD